MTAFTATDRWIASARPRPEAKVRLFCFPYAGGGASVFRGWSDCLPRLVEVHPLQLPGRETRFREPAFTQLAPLVETLAEAQGANSRYVYLSATAVAEHIQAHHPGPRWVLVTGGEPAQYDLRPLVTAIHNIGLKAAIETSGTEVGHVGAGFDWVCVSPKLNMPGGKTVQPAALAVANEIKHVVGRQQDIDELDELLTLALKPDVHICLQPVSISPKATALCLEVVQQRGWRLSVQMHKYIGVK